VTEPPPTRAGLLAAAPASARYLIDLVNDTLDPGYAAAAAARGPDRRRRRYDRPAVALGCLLIGFTVVVAYVHTHRAAPQAAKVHDGLVARVRGAQHDNEALDARVQALATALAHARAQAGAGAANSAVARDALLAGQVAVTGPGLQVVLREPPAKTATPSPGRGDSETQVATNILSDRDVRSVVNELWADGAEAISVNDVRLTPTSAIRFAGQAVLVDFQPISPPYTIRAVGEPDQLDVGFAASDVASRYHTLASADGIGFELTQQSKLTLPASAAVSPRYASPLPSASATRTSR
jgi:uncharacterized protein YlxW (UPF0749 family)